MRFTEIEARLGPDATCRIQDSVASAYRAAGAQVEGVSALRALLVAMLATVVTTERHLAVAEQLAAEDAAQLNALVRKIREIAPHRPATTTPAPAAVAAEAWRRPLWGKEQPPLARRGARAASSTTEQGTVIPFRGTDRRRRPAPEAEEALASPAASLCASRSAIARKKELTAQKREVLARSQALLAQSRSLRTSLEAVHLGQHF
jgi:hypothetical protein